MHLFLPRSHIKNEKNERIGLLHFHGKSLASETKGEQIKYRLDGELSEDEKKVSNKHFNLKLDFHSFDYLPTISLMRIFFWVKQFFV